MSQYIRTRIDGFAGRITLKRPKQLNALNLGMIRSIRAALVSLQMDDRVRLVILDAEGDRAFCAGGDLAAIHRAAIRGNFDAGRQFWAEEYRMNLQIAMSAKPVVSFMHGFTMGGGIGLGCHGAIRIADPMTVFAVSQVRVGLAPDAGTSFLLALAPGRMGEYLATTGRRFAAADALWLGFIDRVIPRADWPKAIRALCDTGTAGVIPPAEPVHSPLAKLLPAANATFGGEDLGDIWRALLHDGSPFATESRAMILEASPLAAAAGVEMMHRLGSRASLAQALELEYRFAYRAQDQGDLVEGIRARIIDKDQSPKWRHSGPDAVPATDMSRMLQPLGHEGWRKT